MLIFELTIGLLAFALVLSSFARRAAIPYPSVLVLGGLALGFAPGLPAVAIDPGLALALFLPPILFDAAYSTSWREFRDNWIPILSLSVGLVLATTAAVAAVAHLLIPDLPWPAAIVLGAIVAPPDAAAATAVMQRLNLPRRMITVLEGESLVNDATSLVLYRFAVAAIVTGSFSLSGALTNFVLIAIGSVALGFAIGRSWLWFIRRFLQEPIINVLLSFVVVFVSYLFAERLALSGVLTVVMLALTFYWGAPEVARPETRLVAFPIWDTVIFLLNVLAFVLIGLQLPDIVAGLSAYGWPELLRYAAAIVGTAILVRILWVMTYNSTVRAKNRRWTPRLAPHLTLPTWQSGVVVSWSGMRGLVSLAAALALPMTTLNGSPFPHRDLVLFLAFSVIFGTLVLQGLTLGPLIRWLRLSDGGAAEREEALARLEAAHAAIAAIDEMDETPALPHGVLASIRATYAARITRLTVEERELEETTNEPNEDFGAAIWLIAIAAERAAVQRLRRESRIGDEPAHLVEQDLDFSELVIKNRRGDTLITWLDTSTNGRKPTASR